MQVTVVKEPDGSLYITKDAHGELYSGELKGTTKIGPDSVIYNNDGVVSFSFIDYQDTSIEGAGEPVCHTVEIAADGASVVGPYTVTVSASD